MIVVLRWLGAFALIFVATALLVTGVEEIGWWAAALLPYALGCCSGSYWLIGVLE